MKHFNERSATRPMQNTIGGFKATVLTSALALSLGATPALAGYDRNVGPAGDSMDVNTAGTMNSMLTVTGRLVRDADDKNFEIRDTFGRTYRIETSRVAGAEQTNKLVAGDVVRIHGQWLDNTLFATNWRYLGKQYVTMGQRVYYAPYYYRVGDRTSVVGTLVSDADDDEFEIRDDRGRLYMIRTRTIPDSFGANKLQKGDRVRVYGYWMITDDRPQLEATNFATLYRRM